MLKYILPLIPEHKSYIEPFLGGAAVFFAKEPASVSILNDANGEVVNFYKVLKREKLREELFQKVEETLFSREQFKEAQNIFNAPDGYSNVDRAWAVFTGFALGRDNGIEAISAAVSREFGSTFNRQKLRLYSDECISRLDTCFIDNTDALKCCMRARKHTFTYLDPPYVGAYQGHYSGYTDEHFERLLKGLPHVLGKFLMSSYDHPLLRSYADKHGWICEEAATHSAISSTRFDILTRNYEV